MKLEILLSCMHHSDLSIVKKSGITGNVLVINQCDKNDYLEKQCNKRSIRMISTTERGLSRSRNKAINNSLGDICLLSDDDEIFVPNYEQIVLEAYKELPDADIIAFDVKNKETRLPERIQKVGYLKSLKLSSCQLTFRRDTVLKNGLFFDPYMGAGSGNGCSEENKFLLDCLNAKLIIYYVPKTVAVLDDSESTWFSGFDEQFFYQRGGATRYMMGMPMALLYGFYYLIAKRRIYRPTISTRNATFQLLSGILENPIKRKGEKQPR